MSKRAERREAKERHQAFVEAQAALRGNAECLSLREATANSLGIAASNVFGLSPLDATAEDSGSPVIGFSSTHSASPTFVSVHDITNNFLAKVGSAREKKISQLVNRAEQRATILQQQQLERQKGKKSTSQGTSPTSATMGSKPIPAAPSSAKPGKSSDADGIMKIAAAAAAAEEAARKELETKTSKQTSTMITGNTGTLSATVLVGPTPEGSDGAVNGDDSSSSSTSSASSEDDDEDIEQAVILGRETTFNDGLGGEATLHIVEAEPPQVDSLGPCEENDDLSSKNVKKKRNRLEDDSAASCDQSQSISEEVDQATLERERQERRLALQAARRLERETAEKLRHKHALHRLQLNFHPSNNNANDPPQSAGATAAASPLFGPSQSILSGLRSFPSSPLTPSAGMPLPMSQPINNHQQQKSTVPPSVPATMRRSTTAPLASNGIPRHLIPMTEINSSSRSIQLQPGDGVAKKEVDRLVKQNSFQASAARSAGIFSADGK